MLITAKTKHKTTNATKHETRRTKAVSQTENGGLSCTGSIKAKGKDNHHRKDEKTKTSKTEIHNDGTGGEGKIANASCCAVKLLDTTEYNQ